MAPRLVLHVQRQFAFAVCQPFCSVDAKLTSDASPGFGSGLPISGPATRAKERESGVLGEESSGEAGERALACT